MVSSFKFNNLFVVVKDYKSSTINYIFNLHFFPRKIILITFWFHLLIYWLFVSITLFHLQNEFDVLFLKIPTLRITILPSIF